MSLKNKRSRTRLPASRANTLPAFVPGSLSTTDIPPSIEDSLQQWLSQSITDPVNSPTAWVSDSTCRCCGQPGCEQFEALANTIKKLEGDTRLAAGTVYRERESESGLLSQARCRVANYFPKKKSVRVCSKNTNPLS